MAKAHGLNIYEYLKFLLEHRPSKDMTDEQLAELVPWSEKLQSIKNRMWIIVNYSNSQRAGVILYLTALIFGAYVWLSWAINCACALIVAFRESTVDVNELTCCNNCLFISSFVNQTTFFRWIWYFYFSGKWKKKQIVSLWYTVKMTVDKQ